MRGFTCGVVIGGILGIIWHLAHIICLLEEILTKL